MPSVPKPEGGLDALDELDRALLRLLQEDARRSHRDLARRTGSTQPTVTSRLGRMEDAGVIQGYTVVLDQEAFAGADLDAPARLECHWCGRRSAEPVWDTLDDRRHPFCCTTCRSAYRKRHDELAQGL